MRAKSRGSYHRRRNAVNVRITCGGVSGQPSIGPISVPSGVLIPIPSQQQQWQRLTIQQR